METLACYFKEYQTFIVGLLGFAGVWYTMRKTASLARSQQDRQIDHERQALRVALATELDQIRSAFRLSIEVFNNTLENEEWKSAYIPRSFSYNIYPQSLHKIGLISPDEIKSVIRAYSLIDDFGYRLETLESSHHPDDQKKSNERSAYLPAKSLKPVIGMYETRLKKVEAALAAINSYLPAELKVAASNKQQTESTP